MAFPVATTANTGVGTATVSPTINYPAGIAPGNTLLAIVRATEGGTITAPNEGTDWIQLDESSADAGNDTTAVFWRRADGTEGTSQTWTSAFSVSGRYTAIVFRITGAADPRGRAPQISTVAVGVSPNEPNATTCTPTGTKDYLWITVFGMDGEQTGITAYPASFTLNQTGLVTTGTTGAVGLNCTMAAAAQNLNAASLDSGVWDVTGTLGNWATWTIAIHPVELIDKWKPNHQDWLDEPKSTVPMGHMPPRVPI
jgi:hypothetical protein